MGLSRKARMKEKDRHTERRVHKGIDKLHAVVIDMA